MPVRLTESEYRHWLLVHQGITGEELEARGRMLVECHCAYPGCLGWTAQAPGVDWYTPKNTRRFADYFRRLKPRA